MTEREFPHRTRTCHFMQPRHEERPGSSGRLHDAHQYWAVKCCTASGLVEEASEPITASLRGNTQHGGRRWVLNVASPIRYTPYVLGKCALTGTFRHFAAPGGVTAGLVRSASRCSDSEVNPTRSANSTLTWRRSEVGCDGSTAGRASSQRGSVAGCARASPRRVSHRTARLTTRSALPYFEVLRCRPRHPRLP